MTIQDITRSLILSGILISFFMATLVLAAPKRKTASKFQLGLFFLTVCLFLCSYALFSGDLASLKGWPVFLLYLLTGLALNPMLYLYVSRLTHHVISQKIKLLHLLPLGITLLIFLFLQFLLPEGLSGYFDQLPIYAPYDPNMPVVLRAGLIFVNDLLFFIQSGIYLILFIRLFIRYAKYIRNVFSNLEGLSLNWLKFFLLIYGLLIGGIFFSEYVLSDIYIYYDALYLTITLIFMLLLGVFGLNQNEIEPVVFAANTSLKPDLTDLLEGKLNEFFQNDTTYLQPDFTIQALAEKLSSNRMYVSRLLNEHLGTSFYDLINKYRMEEAVKILDNDENLRYSIEGVSHMVGYKSKSSFIKHFREYTGMSPGQYRSQTNQSA